MSYSEDALVAKLSTLAETQDSIVGISQWVMFHRRHARQTAEAWAKYLQSVPVNRKLGLIYLANEVVQQSRAKRKDEFVREFAKVLPGALGSAYRAVSSEVKQKIKRVVDVWAQRNVFEDKVLDDIRAAFEAKGVARGGAADLLGGGGILGLGAAAPVKEPAPQVKKLDGLYQDLVPKSGSKIIDEALGSHKSLFESDMLPEPPLYADQLKDVGLKLASAKQMISDRVAIREKILAELEFLTSRVTADQEKDRVLLDDVSAKIQTTEETKAEVLEMINEGVEPAAQPEPEPKPKPTPTPAPARAPAAPASQPHVPEGLDLDAAPAYSPLSDDEDVDEYEPQPKKTKTDNSGGPADKGLEGLDPAVAALLSNMSKN